MAWLSVGTTLLSTSHVESMRLVCFTILQATKLLRGSGGIAVLCFLDLGTRRGWGVSITPQPLSTPGKEPVPIVQEVGWAPGPVCTGAENLAPTGIRSPNCPARSQSLYRLSYLAHGSMSYIYIYIKQCFYCCGREWECLRTRAKENIYKRREERQWQLHLCSVLLYIVRHVSALGKGLHRSM
jgi:hypothetical protein